MTATVRSRRPRALVLASAVTLALASTPAALAQEGEEPVETGVTCDAELLDEEEGVPVYLLEPGTTVTCTAVGLDPELGPDSAGWNADIFGVTVDDFEEDFDEDFGTDLEDEEPLYELGDTLEIGEDGTATFSIDIPEDILVGYLEGVVWQEDAEGALVYEELFDGFIAFDLVEGDMTCSPEPAQVGGDVTCTAAGMTPGPFDHEVHLLTTAELVDSFFGEGDAELEPDAAGTSEADEDGTGAFTFAIPAGSDAELFFAVATQENTVAFYAGEVVPAAAPVDEDDDEDDTPAVAVPRPNRVDAGAGGTAPGGAPSVLLLVFLLVAAAAGGTVLRSRAAE